MKKCEKCGTENADSLSFCTNCGNSIANQAPVAPAAPIAPAPTMPVAPAPAKKTDGKTIGLVAVAAVGLIVGIVGVVLAVTNSGQKEEKKSEPAVSQNPSNEPSGNTVATAGTNDGAVVKLGAYNLTIPKSYQYELEDDYLVVTDAAQTWAAGIFYEDEIAYSLIGSNLDSLSQYLTGQGAQVSTSGQGSANGTSYYYIDFVDSADNLAKTYSFFKAGLKTFEVLTTNGTTVVDHSILNYVEPILSSAKESKDKRDMGIDIGGTSVKTIDLNLSAGLENSEE